MKKRTSAVRWLTTTLGLYAALLVVTVAVVNFVVDPYGEFRFFSASFNELKLKSRDTAAYKVIEQLDEGPHALVFGSSRVQMLSSDILGEPTLNLATSVYTSPTSIWKLLQLLSEKQLTNVSKVYYAVNERMFGDVHPSSLELGVLGNGLERFSNIDYDKVLDALDTIKYNLRVSADERAFEHNITQKGALVKKNSIGNTPTCFVTGIREEQVVVFKKICTFLKTHGIETIFFLTPWKRDAQFEQQVSDVSRVVLARKLLESVDAFYDFYSLYGSPGKNEYFSDGHHLNVEGVKDFAWYLRNPPASHLVTKSNISSYVSSEARELANSVFRCWKGEAVSGYPLSVLLVLDEKDVQKHIEGVDLGAEKLIETIVQIGHRRELLLKPAFTVVQKRLQVSDPLLLNASLNSWPVFKQLLTYENRKGTLAVDTTDVPAALMVQEPELLPVYVRMGGSLDGIESRTGFTPLTLAIAQFPRLLPSLLALKPSLDFPDSRGRYPLILAAYKGNRELCLQLLTAGANPNVRDRAGNTPLRMARGKGGDEIVRLLRSYGARL